LDEEERGNREIQRRINQSVAQNNVISEIQEELDIEIYFKYLNQKQSELLDQCKQLAFVLDQ